MYLVVRVHTVQFLPFQQVLNSFLNHVHLKLNKSFIYKRYAGFELDLVLTLAYTTKASSFIAFITIWHTLLFL